MAYFPNGSAGEVFDAQCARCRFGGQPCPIAMVQVHYNYDAVNNETATAILDDLVKDDGTCAMFELSPDFFERRADPAQQDLPL